MSKKRSNTITAEQLSARLKAATSYITEFVTDPTYSVTTTPEGLTCLRKYPEALSRMQMHVLIVSTQTRTFYELVDLITTNIPSFANFTPVMFADTVVRLIQRGFLSKSTTPEVRPTVNIDGTLTINQDGTISFVPSDSRYSVLSGSRTWLLISNLPSPIPTTRPIHIDGSTTKVNY